MDYAKQILAFIHDSNYIPLKKEDLFFMLSEGEVDHYADFEEALSKLCAEAKIIFTKKNTPANFFFFLFIFFL